MLSADTENDTDVLAITGASAALALSEIPFQKTIAGVRVGLVDGQYVVNPTFEQRKESKLDLIVAGSKDGLVMVEAGAKEVSEAQVVEALNVGARGDQADRRRHRRHGEAAGKKKLAVAKKEIAADFYREIEGKVLGPLTDAMRIRDKLENYETVELTLKNLVSALPEGEAEKKSDAKAIFKELKEKVLREEVLTHNVRLDGRKFDEVRPIWIETGVLPRTHGSAVFTRGETQALVTCTLGTADDAQKIETFEGETWKSFMLHYNFPPFSVGEVGRMSGPGRREVGHGALAERALTPMVPTEEQFPYTMRIVSDILESNGSSSMASVCGGSLAMMDAGVPLKDAGRGHRDGPGDGREDGQVRRPQRHRRRRRSLRRHGLQGRRHVDGHHRAADGHQGRRHHHRGDDARRSTRRAAAGCTSSRRCARRSRRRARTSRTSRRAS